jgi:hypothetical protein
MGYRHMMMLLMPMDAHHFSCSSSDSNYKAESTMPLPKLHCVVGDASWLLFVDHDVRGVSKNMSAKPRGGGREKGEKIFLDKKIRYLLLIRTIIMAHQKERNDAAPLC